MFPRLIEIGYSLFDPRDNKNFHLSAIIHKNKLLVLAENSLKTHSLNRLNPKFGRDGNNITDLRGTCSELAAVKRLKNKTNINPGRCIMVNIRINRLGNLANSCPCAGCHSLLNYFRFKTVYFSTERGFEKYY